MNYFNYHSISCLYKINFTDCYIIFLHYKHHFFKNLKPLIIYYTFYFKFTIFFSGIITSLNLFPLRQLTVILSVEMVRLIRGREMNNFVKYVAPGRPVAALTSAFTIRSENNVF